MNDHEDLKAYIDLKLIKQSAELKEEIGKLFRNEPITELQQSVATIKTKIGVLWAGCALILASLVGLYLTR